MNNQRLAISLMVAQAALFSIETAMIHKIGSQVSIMFLALLRSVGGLVLVLILARRMPHRRWGFVKTQHMPLQLLRGVVALGYLWLMMFSFGKLPLADATAISYTQAAYIAAFSTLMLNERVTGPQWIAALIGVAGALLVVRPGFSEWNFIYLLAVLGTGLNGLAFVLNKVLQRPGGDSELTTMFFVNALAVVCNLPAMAQATLPGPEIWPWLSGVLLFGPIGMYLGIVAVRHADASTLGPYTMLRLVIAVAAGALIFAEVPDGLGLLGTALIVLSCLFAAMRSRAWEPARKLRLWPKAPRSPMPATALAQADR
jgi:drug/metabolite transporter (DMT)-like permease